jgi:hypothetical protein
MEYRCCCSTRTNVENVGYFEHQKSGFHLGALELIPDRMRKYRCRSLAEELALGEE